jgi:hypothetical protein
MRGGLPIYRLKDFHDEEIKGTAESRYTGWWHMENRENSEDEMTRKQ